MRRESRRRVGKNKKVHKDSHQKIFEKWQAEGLQVVSPYSEEQIKNSFDKIGKSVSADVLRVYTSFGGIDWNQPMDSNLLSFWTLDQIVAENSARRSELVFFGDFLIFSHLYGYRYENENISSVYSDFETGEYLKIADSVEDFFRLYLTDPMEIGLYKE